MIGKLVMFSPETSCGQRVKMTSFVNVKNQTCTHHLVMRRLDILSLWTNSGSRHHRPLDDFRVGWSLILEVRGSSAMCVTG